ncbi:MAG: DUF3168 domain-containing protein [Chloroflexota bacterium]
MTIETALRTLIVNDEDIGALIGERCYPLRIPQDVERPAIAYRRISGKRVVSHSGPSNLARPRFEFECVASRYSDLVALANGLRRLLDGRKHTVAGVEIQAGFIENEADDYGDVAQLYGRRLDFFIWHREV